LNFDVDVDQSSFARSGLDLGERIDKTGPELGLGKGLQSLAPYAHLGPLLSGDNALNSDDNGVFENCSAKVWGDSVQLMNMPKVCQSGKGEDSPDEVRSLFRKRLLLAFS
jgi:hypothetical protein